MRIRWLGAAIVVALVGVPGCASVEIPQPSATPASDNPFDDAPLYVSADTSAAKAAEIAVDTASRAAFEQLAATPTAQWLVPERHPTTTITEYVALTQAAAQSQGTLAVYVVYGIPSRDCGNFSAGGTQPAEYHDWVAAIAKGIGETPAAVILEPDAVALSTACGTEDATATFLNDAIDVLSVTAAAIYLDGGHSSWLPPERMASLLSAAGAPRVRGFATNVSNYNATADERLYAEQVSELLDGAHYVIDTSRNGNGSNGEWCNPPGRSIGESPSATSGVGMQDATLWVKVPGESDGLCNGGPEAGAWWDQAALDLVRG